MIGPLAHRTILEPLFLYLQAALASTFPTIERRVRPWDEVTEQPALFLTLKGDEDDWSSNQVLAKTTIECEMVIYSNAGKNPGIDPWVDLATLADKIRAAFAPDNVQDGTFTIGGRVQWARIEGRTDYYPGDWNAEGQAIAAVPVRILVP